MTKTNASSVSHGRTVTSQLKPLSMLFKSRSPSHQTASNVVVESHVSNYGLNPPSNLSDIKYTRHHPSPFIMKGDASEVSGGTHDTQHPVIQRLFPSFPCRRESKSSIRHVRVRNDLPNVTILTLEIKPSTIVQVVDLAIRA